MNGVHTDNIVELVESSLTKKLSNVPQLTSERCIYRVPTVLRAVNPEAYTPKLVSIGPFHRGAPRLQPMDIHKLQYLQDFLDRKPGKTIGFYVENLLGLEERARQCYDEDINYLRSDQFVEMMLIDGCFIIMFMLRDCGWEPQDSNDFLATAPSMTSTLIVDMLLLENQLPFFVIESLFDLLNNNPDGGKRLQFTFLDLSISSFIDNLSIGQDDFLTKYSYKKIDHFVDLIRKSYIPSHKRIPPKGNADLKFIPSATELHEAGVKFEKCKSNCFMDISFSKNGVLRIPPLRIVDETEVYFRNLMALDFFHRYRDNYVTDYVSIMDNLINTPQDVALLRNRGIINNWLGDDEEVSNVFNKLCKGVNIWFPEFYYAQLCENVNAHYEKPWNVWRAKLKRDYFSTPWSTVSFVAAVILLICTITQAVCSIPSF